jgi:hypothetical protein
MPTWKRPSPALVISLLALFVSLGGLGVAATGGNFILGQSNSADSETALNATLNGASSLRVQNGGTAALSNGVLGKITLSTAGSDTAGVKGVNASTDAGAAGVTGQNTGGGPGLKALVKPGAAPLSVNSQTKVDNLNADLLDGVDASGFLTPNLSFAEVAAEITSPTGVGYADDPSSPGPTLTVDVPDAGGGQGFIQVWAQVDANSGQSSIGLFDVTGGGETFVPGQDTVCLNTIPISLPGDLFMTDDGTAGTYGTPMGFDGANCVSTAGPPSPVLLQVTAGTRTFRLEYADCECGGATPTVSNRRLWIAPLRTS